MIRKSSQVISILLLIVAALFLAQCAKKEQTGSEQSESVLEQSQEQEQEQNQQQEGSPDSEAYSEGESGATKKEPAEVENEEGMGLQTGADGLPGTREDVSLPAENDEQATENVEKYLREKGQLGKGDALKNTGDDKKLGTARIIKLQQSHKGIPVYGAETLVIVQDGKVTNVDSKTATNLKLTTEAKLTFEQALKQANELTGSNYKAEGEASKVFYKVANGFYLSWLGRVANEEEILKIIISAEDGSILFTAPERYKDKPS